MTTTTLMPWHGWVMGDSIRQVHALRRLAAWDGVYTELVRTQGRNGCEREYKRPRRYPYDESAIPGAGQKWEEDEKILNPTEMYDKYGDEWVCETMRRKGIDPYAPPPPLPPSPPANPEYARELHEPRRSGTW